MVTEVGFYHLTKTPLDHALLRLLEKVLMAGKRAVVRTSSEERVEFLNGALWTIDSTSFLPHGTNKEGNPSRQPVWITKDNDNPNKAEVLVLTDGAEPKFFDEFERCVEIFDGNDELAIIAARERWEELQRTGIALTYWEQTRVGSWQKKIG